jgi:dTDP-4-dehydrorhamnose 3,5-epimerase-like enzyme
MIFTETRIPGVWLIDADVFPDNRGAFVLGWRPEPFEERGLDTRIAQIGIAVNIKRGTIRGSRAHQEGVRWDDPVFGIDWPLGSPTSINERDATYPDFMVGHEKR